MRKKNNCLSYHLLCVHTYLKFLVFFFFNCRGGLGELTFYAMFKLKEKVCVLRYTAGKEIMM